MGRMQISAIGPKSVRKSLVSTLGMDQTDFDRAPDSEALSESCTEYSMDCLLSDIGLSLTL